MTDAMEDSFGPDEESFSISPDEIMALTDEDLASLTAEHTHEMISVMTASEMLEATPETVTSWAEAEGIIDRTSDMPVAGRLPRNWVLEKIVEQRRKGRLALQPGAVSGAGVPSYYVRDQRFHTTKEVSAARVAISPEAFCSVIDRLSHGRSERGFQSQWVAGAIMVGAALIVIALLVGVMAIIQGMHSTSRINPDETIAHSQLAELERRLDDSENELDRLQARADSEDEEEAETLWDQIHAKEADIADMRAEISRLRALLRAQAPASREHAPDGPAGPFVDE